MAPPSALQFASPTRWKFSRPLSPSSSVVQPLPGTHDGIEEQAARSRTVAKAISRLMSFPLLQWTNLDFTELDGAAGCAARRQIAELQRDRSARELHIADLGGLGAVQHHRHGGTLRRDVEDVPLAASLHRLQDLAAMHDAAGGVGLVGPLVEDVGLVAGLVGQVLGLRAAHVDAAVRIVGGPELDAQLEILVRVVRQEEAALALVAYDRAVLGAPVDVADALEILQAPGAVEQRGPAAARHPRRHRRTGGKQKCS